MAALCELLLPYNIRIEQISSSEAVHRSANTTLGALGTYLLDRGIVSSRMDNGKIVVTLASNFFEVDYTIIVKALIFQSVCLHQLVHRAQDVTDCDIFHLEPADTLNRSYEIEALAAGVAHDLRCKEHLSITGAETLNELSPRLALLLDNSRVFEDSSLAELQVQIRRYS